MDKKTVRFTFDYTCCLWIDGGGLANYDALPLSKSLIEELTSLDDEFITSLGDYPPDPSPWTKEKFLDFFNRAELVYEKLKNELEPKYIVISGLEEDRHMYIDDYV